jgi:hypothetical protein
MKHDGSLRQMALGLGLAILAAAVIAPVTGAASPKTRHLSVSSGETPGNSGSYRPSASATARFVAFA